MPAYKGITVTLIGWYWTCGFVAERQNMSTACYVFLRGIDNNLIRLPWIRHHNLWYDCMHQSGLMKCSVFTVFRSAPGVRTVLGWTLSHQHILHSSTVKSNNPLSGTLCHNVAGDCTSRTETFKPAAVTPFRGFTLMPQLQTPLPFNPTNQSRWLQFLMEPRAGNSRGGFHYPRSLKSSN